MIIYSLSFTFCRNSEKAVWFILLAQYHFKAIQGELGCIVHWMLSIATEMVWMLYMYARKIYLMSQQHIPWVTTNNYTSLKLGLFFFNYRKGILQINFSVWLPLWRKQIGLYGISLFAAWISNLFLEHMIVFNVIGYLQRLWAKRKSAMPAEYYSNDSWVFLHWPMFVV